MIRKKDIVSINYNGRQTLVEFVSCNNSMNLYKNDDTYIKDEYLCNIWSRYSCFDSTTCFHRKLKIFTNDTHGKYVVCQDRRCYFNGLYEELKNKQ